MLRAILLYLSNASWARAMVTGWRIGRRMASRFVAGDSFDEALQAVRKLNSDGVFATLDHLGENVSNREEAQQAAHEYVEIFQQLHESGVSSNASLKLSQLGLNVSFDLCLENMRQIATRAREHGMLVRIDMEDSSTVDQTLEIQRTLRNEGLDNIGVVVQAYLYRSEDDLAQLMEEGTPVRLCKGAYKEPPEVAFPKKADVDANYDRLAARMIEAAVAAGSKPADPIGKCPPLAAIATHDEQRIAFAREHARKAGLPNEALEFQMLYGIRNNLLRQLSREGYPTRVYVPYGSEWYPYFMRRLAERPANLWFFLSAFFRGS